MCYNLNKPDEIVTIKEALLRGLGSDYGLFMLTHIPKLSADVISRMKNKSYSEIAFDVLNPFLDSEIPSDKLRELLDDAYREDVIPIDVQHIDERTNILWLTHGPTYSFKDFAARFYARLLSYFLGEENYEINALIKAVIDGTSGDTGGAIGDGLYEVPGVCNIVFYPGGAITEGQRRQMTTLGKNVYAFEVNGPFDVCQAIVKYLQGDLEFAEEVFNNRNIWTTANSINIARILPQIVFPFFVYSRIAEYPEPILPSIPSGNFGDITGTLIAKFMGLPMSKILCGVNENTEFPEFLDTGKFVIRPTKETPSSAMDVSYASNLQRLLALYFGHMYDKRDSDGTVIKPGVIDVMPDMDAMRKDIFSMGVNTQQHYETIKEVYDKHGIIICPHTAVGWKVLEEYSRQFPGNEPACVYATADPGKFPDVVEKALGIVPDLPKGMMEQRNLPERIYKIESEPDYTSEGPKLSRAQIDEVKDTIRSLFS